jgi:hypothetical protein
MVIHFNVSVDEGGGEDGLRGVKLGTPDVQFLIGEVERRLHADLLLHRYC